MSCLVVCWLANDLLRYAAVVPSLNSSMVPEHTLLGVLVLGWILAAATANKHKYADHTVHAVFSNHLDVGFTDLDSNVINLYFHQHYPQAIKLAQDLAVSPDNPHGDVFRYTTHSWLLSLFFDCPPNMGFRCPNNTEVSAVRAAIKDGIITWHAAPFNPQYEVFDSWLLGAALDLTHDLDDSFGVPHKQMISLRDVPGLTRAALPVFKSRGIKGLTVGVNGFSAPPGVPHMTPFLWRDRESGSEIIAMWHPGSYSGTTYGLQIDSRKDCIRAPGLKHVLCVAWRNDNSGPPDSLGELLTMFRILRQQWPGAKIITSSLETYLGQLTSAVQSNRVKLPVVTGEIGDTWVHGIASDPGKMADYRAVLRAVQECHKHQGCDMQGPEFKNFTRLLIKVAEHTWGVSFNWYFGDATNYTNTWLHNMLAEGEIKHQNLAVTLESWRRQRQYIDWALEALPEGHLIREYVQRDRDLRHHMSEISVESIAANGGVGIVHNMENDSSSREVGSIDSSSTGSSSSRDVDSGSSSSGRDDIQGPAAAADVSDSSCRSNREELLVCSKHWLIQINKETGGLLRLQRRYDSQMASRSHSLGNDWAAAAAAAETEHHPAAAAATDSSSSSTVKQQHRLLLDQSLQQQQQMMKQHSSSSSSGSAFAELQYNVYSLQDYDFVWENYAYIHPVWVGDFGKWNMSATVNMSQTAKPKLVDVFETSDASGGLQIQMRLEFPSELVQEAGAPETLWVVLHSPSDSPQLNLTVIWQNKTATRLPEALWLRFKPGRGAVDRNSWTMNKFDSNIKPTEVVLNGSHSIHAVNRGISVSSRDGSERLTIKTLDVPLVNAGKPNPFYNPSDGPDMSEGMSYNIVNNIWGTNYIMWVPYDKRYEPGMAFRFVIEADRNDAALEGRVAMAR